MISNSKKCNQDWDNKTLLLFLSYRKTLILACLHLSNWKNSKHYTWEQEGGTSIVIGITLSTEDNFFMLFLTIYKKWIPKKLNHKRRHQKKKIAKKKDGQNRGEEKKVKKKSKKEKSQENELVMAMSLESWHSTYIIPKLIHYGGFILAIANFSLSNVVHAIMINSKRRNSSCQFFQSTFL